MTPQGRQRLRTAGWTMPPNARYVGRGQGDYGKFGNPFRMQGNTWGEHLAVVDLHREHLERRAAGKPHQLPANYPSDDEIRRELAGLDLVCWCREGWPCHRNTLLAIANEGDHV